jgi:DNA-binding HxlR family transcriptional regulator
MVTTTARDGKLLHCPALIAIRAISGKWKTRILWLLRDRPHHFGELKMLLPGVSAKVLSEQLHQLADDDLVHAAEQMRGGVGFMIYDYTAHGRALIPALDLLGAWGLDHAATNPGRVGPPHG